MHPSSPPRWQRWLASARWPRFFQLRRRLNRLWTTPGGLVGALVALWVLYGIWLFTGMQALLASPWLR